MIGRLHSWVAGFGFAGVLAAIALWVGLIIGWVLNLVAIFNFNFAAAVTAELVIRLVGIFFFPLGGVMGWL
jgi:hypothetical protein